VQRKVITPGDFANLHELAARLLALQDRYNATAEPFDWHFIRASLDRLATHESLATTPDDSTTGATSGGRPSAGWIVPAGVADWRTTAAGASIPRFGGSTWGPAAEPEAMSRWLRASSGLPWSAAKTL
jgi:hypothetical protein